MRLSILFPALLGCVFVLPARGEDAKDELKALAGKWKVVAIEADGKKVPAAELKDMSWTFSGSEVEYNPGGEAKVTGKYTIKLDPSKAPRQIDLTGTGMFTGKFILGIYKREKDRLVVCMRRPEEEKKGRPKDFSVGDDTTLSLITLERVK